MPTPRWLDGTRACQTYRPTSIMTTASVREVQHNLAAVLERVSRGQEVAVTRRGQVIAHRPRLGPRRRPELAGFRCPDEAPRGNGDAGNAHERPHLRVARGTGLSAYFDSSIVTKWYLPEADSAAAL